MLRTIPFVLFCILGGLALQAQTFIQVNINQPPALSGDAGLDGLICPGDSFLIGGLSPLGGTPPYGYSWSPTSGLSNSGIAQPMASPGVSTNYVLTVSDLANCTAFDTVFVEIDTCVGLVPGIGIEAFDLFPNPSAGQFKVLLRGNYLQAPLQLRVMNALGQVITTRTLGTLSGQLETDFDLQRVSKGSYIVEIRAGDVRLTRRIVLH